jgi:hypothetical protein
VRLNLKKSLKDDLQLASKNVAKLLKLDLEGLRQLMASIVTPYPDRKLWSFVYDCANFALAPALGAGKANQAQIAKNLKSLYMSLYYSLCTRFSQYRNSFFASAANNECSRWSHSYASVR